MKKVVLLLLAAAAAVGAVAIARGLSPQASNASSHREAPLISDDPSADNTDLYAFRSPDKPDTVTIVSNWIPGEDPAAGPNYYTFSPSARYNIYIDKTGDAKPDTTFRFTFTRGPGQFFLGNTVQDYTVTKIEGNQSSVVATGKTPPNNIGPKSTPNYHTLVQQAIPQLQGGGKDFLAGYAVHAIALQLPISQLDNGSNHVIGVWASTDRQAVTVRTVTVKKKVRVKGKLVTRTTRRQVVTRPWVQVSRLGNPLVNEVIIPTTRKDAWNASTPDKDSQFAQYYTDPILAAVMNTLFPNVINAPEHNRDDLVAVLLTGVPGLNNTGPTQADLLRRHLTTP